MLALREFNHMSPAMEFRCIVYHKTLIGVCQRHASRFYPFLPPMKEHIQKSVQSLFATALKDQFLLEDCKLCCCFLCLTKRYF